MRNDHPTGDRQTAGTAWKLVWQDEFDGGAIDRTKWTFDIGSRLYVPERDIWIVGWGEESLQYHTDRPDNAFVREGCLTIRARREDRGGCPYTSARMHTKGLFEKRYGRFEVRARMPLGQGLWGGICLFPARNTYGLWAASGEIDIAETVGQRPEQVLGTIHFGSGWPHNRYETLTYALPQGDIGGFHVYALEWEFGILRWYVDDVLYSTKTRWWSCSKTSPSGEGEPPAQTEECNPFPAPFDQAFYIIMMQNVGGMLPGAPDGGTRFPSDMVVDYVRVYDRVGKSGGR